MSLISKTLGHYQITSQLGKGGMGEVYRARDTKLGREVAIKVLPEDFARDAARMARFGREAKLLAALNHTNIASIYGLEDSSNTHGLVMELAQGSTLEERIKQGPIPVEEAIPIARQMADALEYAHERGIIHRDLKPANVKVAADDTVKILDFGLAKAMETEQSGEVSTNSPTVSHLATQAGVLLGTAAYMSPEQAKAKPVDRRADIWAFGCVLYEMLTGKMAFHGEAVTDTLAAVLKNEPDWSLLPMETPMRIRVLLQRCLQKDPKQRLRDIGDARISLDEVLSGAPEGAPLPVAASPFWRRAMPWVWVAAGVILAAVITGIAVWKLKPVEPRQEVRFDYELPQGQQIGPPIIPTLAVSPDGRRFAYGTSQGLYLRSVDELEAKLIPGTEGEIDTPFFSPDGKWVGYYSVKDTQLKKIAVNGGAPVTLCSATQILGATWYEDNTIVFGQVQDGIMRISANGGTAESLVKAKNESLISPQILPDGKSVLYTVATGPTQAKVMVRSLKPGEPKELFAGVFVRYLPTGHIVCQLPDTNSLSAVPFDLDKLSVNGGPVPLIEDVQQAAVSDSGTLAYLPGKLFAGSIAQRTLVWVDRNGKEELISATPNTYAHPRISPDGTRIALTIVGSTNSNLWIWDLVRKTLTRLTFEETADLYPLWTPDGKRIAYFTAGKGKGGLSWKAADGTGKDEPLVSSTDRSLFPESWSGEGKMLVFDEVIGQAAPATASLLQIVLTAPIVPPRAGPQPQVSIGMLPVEGEHVTKVLLQGKFVVASPQISPDGKWMAYVSTESGQNEIYVRPFPQVESGKWQVSTSGGQEPRWSPNGRELFYRSGDAMMAVPVSTEPTFKAGAPERLFRGPYYSFVGRMWDLSPDGKRFLMIKRESATQASAPEARPRINIVLNWTEELKQRVPVK